MCVWLTLILQKRTIYFYVFLLFVSFCGLTKFLCSRLEKVSPKKYNEEENGRMEYTFSCRKSNVKRRKSVLTLLVEIERVRAFCLEVILERVCWPCKWKYERELCWLSKWNCEKESECWKIRVFIEHSCHWIGSKIAGEDWSSGHSFEHSPRGSPGL